MCLLGIKELWQTISANLRACEFFKFFAVAGALCHNLNSNGRSCALHRFTLTPPRMRMITDAFTETLELGLKQPGQVVVRRTRF